MRTLTEAGVAVQERRADARFDLGRILGREGIARDADGIVLRGGRARCPEYRQRDQPSGPAGITVEHPGADEPMAQPLCQLADSYTAQFAGVGALIRGRA